MEGAQDIRPLVISDRRFYVRIHRSGRVDCRAEFELPLPASAAWGQLRDFRRSASQDYFHRQIHIEGDVPRHRAGLVLEHRFGPFRTRRIGRILRWREWDASGASGDGRCEAAGYSFSDLSELGPRVGFPHVLSYYLHAASRGTCRLVITVRGRWTAKENPALGWQTVARLGVPSCSEFGSQQSPGGRGRRVRARIGRVQSAVAPFPCAIRVRPALSLAFFFSGIPAGWR